jgi:hypothetical protein
LWDSGGEVERDNIAVIEVMVENLDPEFWRFLRGPSIRRRRSSSGHKK